MNKNRQKPDIMESSSKLVKFSENHELQTLTAKNISELKSVFIQQENNSEPFDIFPTMASQGSNLSYLDAMPKSTSTPISCPITQKSFQQKVLIHEQDHSKNFTQELTSTNTKTQKLLDSTTFESCSDMSRIFEKTQKSKPSEPTLCLKIYFFYS